MSVFQGSAVAIITPYHNGAVEFTAYTRLIELQIASGTDAIVVCGPTGDSSTLSLDEKLSVIQFVVERVNWRVPVIAGTGGNSTEPVIETSRTAEAHGVAARTEMGWRLTPRGFFVSYAIIVSLLEAVGRERQRKLCRAAEGDFSVEV